MSIRVLVADDEAMIRAGIRSILTTDPAIEVVAEAADGREAVDSALAHRPGVVLMDVRMPRLDGLSAAAELRGAAPEIAVVVLTTFDEDDYVGAAHVAGAAG
ncbi:response regulator transcription factor, partial [Rhodococcus sp. NPDC058514]|uniref:response regulator n=1 Tax=Rhodococcus sp. NPDC058514 TaxID=3346532 RepID=UPI00365F0D50